MAEILGIGVTHSPSLITPDELKNYSLTRALKNERIPAERKNPENWPQAMREEWGDDQGYASALYHREKLVEGFRRIREELDAFDPDVVLVWGDDQYENFREDIIPAFCVMAYESFESQPFTNKDGTRRINVWDEPGDKTFRYRGHPSARYLAGALIGDGFDVAYAYRPLHEPGLGHAFLNTLLYLDYDRKGFDYPVLPFAVNCYGSRIIRNRGGATPQTANGRELAADPPGPSPKSLHGIGRRHGPGAAGQPLAGGADRFFQLVPRLSHRKEFLALPGRGVGPGAVRRVQRGQLQGVAHSYHTPDRRRRATGDAELDVLGRGPSPAGAHTGNRRVRADLRVQLQQMPGGSQTLANDENAERAKNAAFSQFFRWSIGDLVLSQRGFGICSRKEPIELSCLVGSVEGGGGSDGQGQIRGGTGTGTTGRAPSTDPGWQKLSPSDR